MPAPMNTTTALLASNFRRASQHGELTSASACVQEKLKESGVADRLAPVTTAAAETKTLFSQVCAPTENVFSYDRCRDKHARARTHTHTHTPMTMVRALRAQLGSTLETSFNSQVCG